MNSIKNRITFSMLLLIVLLLFCSSAGSYFISRNILVNQYSNKMSISSEKYSEIVNGWLDKETIKFKDIVDNMYDNNIIGDNNKLTDYFKQKLKANPNISDLYMGFTNKTHIDGSGWIPPSDFDPTKRDWYKNAISKNGIVYVPYYDLVTKKMVVSISTTVSKDGVLLGVVSEDIKMDSITNVIEKAKPIENSYGYLIDDRNNVLVHPYKDLKPEKDKLKSLYDFMGGKYKTITEKNGQIINMDDYDGINKYFSASKVNASNWTIGFAVPKSEFTKDLRSLIALNLIIFIICIVAAIIFSRYVAIIISRPIDNIRHVIAQIGKLNFNYNANKLDSVINNRDELADIAVDIQSLSKTLTSVVQDIKNSSYDVLEYSNSILHALNESSTSIEEISKTAEEMASDSVLQAGEANKGNEKLNDLSDKINNIAGKANKFKEHFSNVKSINDNGILEIKSLNLKLNDNNKTVWEAARNMNDLAEKSKSIVKIVDEIEAVSEQTNLLALNAAIEAARAGEAGKGFSVVAGEVRLLSEETKKSVTNISKVVNEISEEIKTVLKNVESVAKTNTEVNESMEKSNESFNTMKKSMDEIILNIDGLFEKINQVDADKNLVVKSIESISSISEKSSEGSQELAASVEEQNNSIESINMSMKKLKGISEKLDDIVGKFNLEDN
ncbi:chemotaxis protein [Clostridium carboxidivorans P7]|uniref:Methyl-accepting chemotaxis sensory transducer with Cache sensor n=1 Tax=Clostridium carboxidivorans P7 TaxID=536227 RepID=C6PTT5_9CLOT|nr:methyl-accepting chemotaxis protein [Clostridium carboxidivorans]AKN31443.1 chemotaxis protein [Clostridium carboxidivorans P7]EET87325.1 methyl-accepting chemotaxis sensory transducer with Cache sensor [Clostridium carboxidivorans P7]EFG87167.1 methyl-accepting chemotaxis protein signaling domain protein [Clostridium carboxidivorans P7]